MSRRKLILATFVFLALISFGAGIFVHLYFAQHSPTEPRPREGKTYRAIANKVSVYLTREELIAFYLPGISFFVWFGALGYFGVRWRLVKVASGSPEFEFPVARKQKKNGGG
jgi:hypothetical protein